MKNYNFKIPVADILKESSIKDTILFTEKFSTLLPQLIDPGISIEMEIQWMDKTSLLITIKKGLAPCAYPCDRCWTTTTKDISLEEKQVKCFFEDTKNHTIEDDDIIYIDKNKKIVDLEIFLTQSFLLTDDLVHLCKNCAKEKTDDDSENEDSFHTIVRK